MHVSEQEGSTRKDFFSSYNADIRWAEWITWQLEEEGYSVMLQGWDCRPGANMVLELDTSAHQTIVVLSPNYSNVLSTLPEWTTAFKRDTSRWQTPLLPVRVQSCEVKGLLKQLISSIWLHAFNRFRRSQEPFVGQLAVLTPDGIVEHDKQHTPLAVVSFTDLTDMDLSFGISSQMWFHLSYQNGSVKPQLQMD